jgi:superfamily II DNA or RNA helicase
MAQLDPAIPTPLTCGIVPATTPVCLRTAEPGKKARSAALATLTAPDPTGGLLLLATGSYLGEGFDCPQLDTLSWPFRLPSRAA